MCVGRAPSVRTLSLAKGGLLLTRRCYGRAGKSQENRVDAQARPNVRPMLRIDSVSVQRACVAGTIPNAKKKAEGLQSSRAVLVGREREV